MSEQAKAVEAKAAQKSQAKRATMEALRGKKPVEKDVTIKIGDEEMSFLLRSIGSRAYDKMVNECPATTEQLSRGDRVDPDRMGPRLLAKTVIEPELSVDEWTEIWNSPDWSRGEIMSLYNEAGLINMSGLDITPTAAG